MSNTILNFSIKNCPTSWVVVKWLLTDTSLNKMMRKYLEKTKYPCYYDFLIYYQLIGTLTPDSKFFDADGIDFDEVDDVFESIKKLLAYKIPILFCVCSFGGLFDEYRQ